MPAAKKSPSFRRLTREARLSDRVAGQILQVILDTPLDPGEELPSERALGEQFEVSRTVIREAVRSLTGKGVVERSRGNRLLVASVEPGAIRESVRLFLRTRPELDYVKVHQVRSLLETEVAGLAAERATAADLRSMADACEAMALVLEDPGAASECDLAFHRLLAQATGNELFDVLLDAISAPLVEIRIDTFELVPHRAETALAAHRGIYEQVARHDIEAARAAMRRHLDDVLVAWRRAHRKLHEIQSLMMRQPGPSGRIVPASPDGTPSATR